MNGMHRPLIPGATYFITSTTHERHRWFADPDLAQVVVDQWNRYERAYQFRLDAYSVLPDHYHAVLAVGTAKSISQILHAVHSYTATLINRKLGHGTKVPIWQGSAWDEVIRDEDMYWQKVAYTLLNP